MREEARDLNSRVEPNIDMKLNLIFADRMWLETIREDTKIKDLF